MAIVPEEWYWFRICCVALSDITEIRCGACYCTTLLSIPCDTSLIWRSSSAAIWTRVLLLNSYPSAERRDSNANSDTHTWQREEWRQPPLTRHCSSFQCAAGDCSQNLVSWAEKNLLSASGRGRWVLISGMFLQTRAVLQRVSGFGLGFKSCRLPVFYSSHVCTLTHACAHTVLFLPFLLVTKWFVLEINTLILFLVCCG